MIGICGGTIGIDDFRICLDVVELLLELSYGILRVLRRTELGVCEGVKRSTSPLLIGKCAADGHAEKPRAERGKAAGCRCPSVERARGSRDKACMKGAGAQDASPGGLQRHDERHGAEQSTSAGWKV